MLTHKVGACFSKTFVKIADYFEFDLYDYRKADKVYRIGLESLETNDKELKNLTCLYGRFRDRMQERLEREVKAEVEEIRNN